VVSLFTLFKKAKVEADFISVVSGLPRSGTSMMMQVLEAGGIHAVTDNVRQADSDNKALSRGNQACLHNAEGRAVKVISTLLRYLSKKKKYKIIFMHRDLDEVLASQKKMLINLNSTSEKNNDDELIQHYKQHIERILTWLSKQENIDVLQLNYVDLLNNKNKHINDLISFLNLKLNKKKMASVIDVSMQHHS